MGRQIGFSAIDAFDHFAFGINGISLKEEATKFIGGGATHGLTSNITRVGVVGDVFSTVGDPSFPDDHVFSGNHITGLSIVAGRTAADLNICVINVHISFGHC